MVVVASKTLTPESTPVIVTILVPNVIALVVLPVNNNFPNVRLQLLVKTVP